MTTRWVSWPGWGVHPLDIAYWGHPEMMNGPVTIEGQGHHPDERRMQYGDRLGCSVRL